MSCIVSRRGNWLLLKAGNYHWLQTSRVKKIAIYRVRFEGHIPIYEALFGGRIPQYAKQMVEDYCKDGG